jgi:hypothetical protein
VQLINLSNDNAFRSFVSKKKNNPYKNNAYSVTKRCTCLEAIEFVAEVLRVYTPLTTVDDFQSQSQYHEFLHRQELEEEQQEVEQEDANGDSRFNRSTRKRRHQQKRKVHQYQHQRIPFQLSAHNSGTTINSSNTSSSHRLPKGIPVQIQSLIIEDFYFWLMKRGFTLIPYDSLLISSANEMAGYNKIETMQLLENARQFRESENSKSGQLVPLSTVIVWLLRNLTKRAYLVNMVGVAEDIHGVMTDESEANRLDDDTDSNNSQQEEATKATTNVPFFRYSAVPYPPPIRIPQQLPPQPPLTGTSFSLS